MSENNENKDLEKQAEENLKSEIIESDSIPQESNTVEPIIVKKGSFLSFVAFVFSIAALSISGYQYYLQNNSAKTIEQTETWQQALTNLDVKIQKQSNNMSLQVSDLKKNTQDLSQKIQALQQTNQLISTNNDSSNNPVSKQFDDSEIKQNISDLTQQLTTQKKLYEQLQENLTNNNQQQSQSLLKFKQKYENDKSTQPVALQVTDSIQKQKAMDIDLIRTNLISAHKFLNIMGNVDNSVKALDGAISHLNNLANSTYADFINELTNLSESLSTVKKVDVFSINKELEALEKNINELKFANSPVPNENQESSWYDNLVKIKKIDVDQQKLLTNSEQVTIRQKLKLHLGLLRSALINQNQDLWSLEINQIIELTSNTFADTAGLAINKLNQLKDININPNFPDLTVYIQKFNDLTTSDHESE
jgi:uncharacterized protein HemX